jgi:hypothetical protein
MPKNVTVGDYFKAWLLYIVCATLSGAVIGAGVGVLIRVAARALDYSLPTGGAFAIVFGFVVGMPVSFLFFWLFVRYFIVRKLATAPSDPTNVHAA